MYYTASELHNDFLRICFDEYKELSDAKRNKTEPKYDPDNLFFKTYNSDDWLENEESINTTRESDKEEPDMPPLEGDEDEVKESKWLRILTPNKLLTRLPISLVQIKTGNNSYKLKNEIRQILHLLYQQYKIPEKVYNKLIKSL